MPTFQLVSSSYVQKPAPGGVKPQTGLHEPFAPHWERAVPETAPVTAVAPASLVLNMQRPGAEVYVKVSHVQNLHPAKALQAAQQASADAVVLVLPRSLPVKSISTRTTPQAPVGGGHVGGPSVHSFELGGNGHLNLFVGCDAFSRLHAVVYCPKGKLGTVPVNLFPNTSRPFKFDKLFHELGSVPPNLFE